MQQEKFEREILVVPRNILFAEKSFQGFLNFEEYNYIPIILKNFIWIKRKEAEFNPKYQQIIPYGVIVDSKSRSIFVYRRSSGQAYAEKRLYNKISLGVGGHIEKEDLAEEKNYSVKNIFERCLLREIREEINVENALNLFLFSLFGFLKLEDNSIDKDHFGIVYLIEMPKSKMKLNKGEISSGKFVSFKELCSLRELAEGWTSALIDPLVDYYENTNQSKK
ncbi:MAG: NUDIX domain-containing protein [Candidatus Woesearchaeota archaeon]